MHVSNVVDNFNPAPHSCKRDYESYVSTWEINNQSQILKMIALCAII